MYAIIQHPKHRLHVEVNQDFHYAAFYRYLACMKLQKSQGRRRTEQRLTDYGFIFLNEQSSPGNIFSPWQKSKAVLHTAVKADRRAPSPPLCRSSSSAAQCRGGRCCLCLTAALASGVSAGTHEGVPISNLYHE